MKRGKNYIDSKKLIENNKLYDSEEAMALAIQKMDRKDGPYVRFAFDLNPAVVHGDKLTRQVQADTCS